MPQDAPQSKAGENPTRQTDALHERIALETTAGTRYVDLPPGTVPSDSSPDRRGALLKRIASDFRYHAPRGNQLESYEKLRSKARELAELYAHHCPESRELSTALTRLEESVMHANAAIARHG